MALYAPIVLYGATMRPYQSGALDALQANELDAVGATTLVVGGGITANLTLGTAGMVGVNAIQVPGDLDIQGVLTVIGGAQFEETGDVVFDDNVKFGDNADLPDTVKFVSTIIPNALGGDALASIRFDKGSDAIIRMETIVAAGNPKNLSILGGNASALDNLKGGDITIQAGKGGTQGAVGSTGGDLFIYSGEGNTGGGTSRSGDITIDNYAADAPGEMFIGYNNSPGIYIGDSTCVNVFKDYVEINGGGVSILEIWIPIAPALGGVGLLLQKGFPGIITMQEATPPDADVQPSPLYLRGGNTSAFFGSKGGDVYVVGGTGGATVPLAGGGDVNIVSGVATDAVHPSGNINITVGVNITLGSINIGTTLAQAINIGVVGAPGSVTTIYGGLNFDGLLNGSDVVAAQFTGANVNTLTNGPGSDASALHTHAGLTGSMLFDYNTAASTAVGYVCYSSASGVASDANAVALATSRCLGVVSVKNAAGKVSTGPMVTVAVKATDIPAAGTPCFLSDTDAGKVQGTPPVTATHCVVELGIAAFTAAAGFIQMVWQPKQIIEITAPA